MTVDCVEQRDGGFYVASVRVSLDSVVYAFRDGESPETIQQNFRPSRWNRSTARIAFYLWRQAEIDANIRVGEEEVRRLMPPLSQRKPEAYTRLQRVREQMAGR
jgi:hypothetical protein